MNLQSLPHTISSSHFLPKETIHEKKNSFPFANEFIIVSCKTKCPLFLEIFTTSIQAKFFAQLCHNDYNRQRRIVRQPSGSSTVEGAFSFLYSIQFTVFCLFNLLQASLSILSTQNMNTNPSSKHTNCKHDVKAGSELSTCLSSRTGLEAN